MSALLQVNKKAFSNGRNRIVGRDIRIKTTTGAPSAAAKVGTIVWNSYDLNAYICTVAAGTYVKINA